MKKHNKVLLAVLCAALLVVATVCGTLAYFTDQEAVLNTFTVGKVDIDLNETDVDGDQNTKANAYHLIPGQSYVKDPTVTVEAGSEASYIRMLVTPSNLEALVNAFPEFVAEDGVFLLQNLVEGWNPAVWEFVDCVDGVYEFRYFETADGADGELAPLFEEIVVPTTANNADMKVLAGMQINVVAQAIQAEGFADADAAWAAFAIQHP